MARILTCGFEMGDVRVEPAGGTGASPTFLNGTPAIDTGTVRSGARSLKIDLTSAAQAIRWNGMGGLDQSQYHRLYIRFQAFPTSASFLVSQRPTGVGVRINSSGQLEARFNDASALATIGVSLNTWYCLEFMQTIRAAATDDIEFRLDGVTWYSSIGVERSATNSGNFDIGSGSTGNSCVFYVDDVAVNDNTAGAGQNSWPGPGKIVTLIPTSDSARTGYTGGAGGTTNLFDAVNNVPPIGTTAAADTNLTQIKGVTNATTDVYSPNLQTYTVKGLVSTDYVRVAFAYHRFANATTTTARSQGIQGTSNPVIAEATSNSSGSTAAAEISTTWVTRTTVMSYLPTPSFGGAPVIRTRKNTASTNEHAVDAMGMYVEYDTIPTTVTDNFNRTAEDPLNDSGRWQGPIKTGDAAGETDGTQFIADGGTTESAYRNDFGQIADVAVTGVLGTIVENYLFARVTTPGTATPDGYCLIVLPGNVLEIHRMDNGTLTRLGTSISATVASGDTVRFQLIGTSLKAYVNGVEVAARTDATYGTGYTGIQAYNGGAWNSWTASPPVHPVGGPVSLGKDVGTGSSGDISITTTAAIPAGARVFWVWSWIQQPATRFTITPSGTNGLTFVTDWSRDDGLATDKQCVLIMSAPCPGGLASGQTFTSTMTGASQWGALSSMFYLTEVQDYSYTDGAATDKYTVGNPGNPNWSTNTLVTTVAEDMLIAVNFADGTVVGDATVTAPFIELDEVWDATNGWKMQVAYRPVFATGSYSAAGTHSNNPGFNQAQWLFAFDQGSSTPPSTARRTGPAQTCSPTYKRRAGSY